MAVAGYPYYNKPEQHGLMAHLLEAVAKNTSLPIILYNIPGRTGRLIDVKHYAGLAKIDNIIGVKDAAANINQSMALLQVTRTQQKVLCPQSGECLDVSPGLPGW